MPYTSWRGSVGLIKPTMRPGSLEEFIRLLPEGIGVLPLFLGIKRGTEEEFRGVLKAFEEKVEELAQLKVDLVHPEGAPPFMVQGYKGEERIKKKGKKKYGVLVVRGGRPQEEALRTLKPKKAPIFFLPFFDDPLLTF